MAVVAVLLVANVAWRIWDGWGLITIDVKDAPVAEIVRKLERQGHVRIATNLPPDLKASLHVHKVTLVRALEIFANTIGARWSVAYVTAPNSKVIDAALLDFSGNGTTTGWRRFAFGGPGPGGAGGIDPRSEKWTPTVEQEATLHAYLNQASQILDGEFWVPEDWNPTVAKAPSEGTPVRAVAELAKTAGGAFADVILLQKREVQLSDRGEAPPPPPDAQGGNNASRGPDARPQGPPRQGGDPAMMEARALARIAALPKDQQEDARQRLEERRKFFEEIRDLPPEERQEKIEAHMEEMSRRDVMTKMGASRSVEERTQFYRRVVQDREERRQ